MAARPSRSRLLSCTASAEACHGVLSAWRAEVEVQMRVCDSVRLGETTSRGADRRRRSERRRPCAQYRGSSRRPRALTHPRGDEPAVGPAETDTPSAWGRHERRALLGGRRFPRPARRQHRRPSVIGEERGKAASSRSPRGARAGGSSRQASRAVAAQREPVGPQIPLIACRALSSLSYKLNARPGGKVPAARGAARLPGRAPRGRIDSPAEAAYNARVRRIRRLGPAEAAGASRGGWGQPRRPGEGAAGPAEGNETTKARGTD